MVLLVFTSANGPKYIEGELAEKVPLQDIHRNQGFLTIENYVKLHELLWFNDHHDYTHEGARVDNGCLLNSHCFTAARVQELCQAKYEARDPILVIAASQYLQSYRTSCSWSDGTTENRSTSLKSGEENVRERIRDSKWFDATVYIFMLTEFI